MKKPQRPKLMSEAALASGPRLPRNGAPRPVTLPLMDHWASVGMPPVPSPRVEVVLQSSEEEDTAEAEEESEDASSYWEAPELEKQDLADKVSSIADGAEACQQRSCCCPCCEYFGEVADHEKERSFHRLLAELAVEHRRSLLRLRAEIEEPDKLGDRPRHVLLDKPTISKNTLSSDSKMNDFRGPSLEATVTEHRMSPFDFVSESSQIGLDLPKGKTQELKDHLTNIFRSRGNLLERLWRDLGSLATRQTLDSVSAAAIILNSVLAGCVANEAVESAFLRGRQPSDSTDTQISPWFQYVFTAWFLIELLLRIWLDRPRRFYFGSDWTWNWFDSSVVATDCILAIVEGMQTDTGGGMRNLTVLRILRVLRISRAMRVLRLVRIFRELRMMVFSILHSGSSLLWSLVLLAITIYTFALYFVQVVTYHVPTLTSLGSGQDIASKVAEYEELNEKFGNLLNAMYTLYQSISGGINWGEITKLLVPMHPAHGVVFCFYTFFTTFALLNIITGVFVETSITSARSNQEEVTQDQLDSTRSMVEEMRRMFEGADKDRSGTISLNEFEVYLNCKEVRAYLNALGIEADKAKGLFQLLDLDMSGEITIDEFCFGCLRLKGNAKSIDLASLTNQTIRMADQFRRFFTWAEEQFKNLHEFEQRLDQRLSFFESEGPDGGT